MSHPISIPSLHALQKAHFQTGATLSIQARKKALHTLRTGLHHWEARLLEAVQKDLGKSGFEAYTNEIGVLHAELSHTIAQLASWMKPKSVRPEIFLLPGQGQIRAEPMGTTLIIAPWNYPIQLLLAPLIAALAAGNTAVLKPSELSVHTEAVLVAMIRELYAPELVAIVTGGPDVTTELLAQPFDKYFFTGSPAVGKIVMRAAAEHLASVTLELGGKSPAIVDHSADIRVAARKIAWGKFNNAGQTCVAPDYVLVDHRVRDAFMAELGKAITQFYTDQPHASPHYGRIINHRHFDRLGAYLSQGTIIHGGQTVRDERYMAPTVMEPASWDVPLMQDEIFGPILPVLSFKDPQEVIGLVNRRPNPLALYVFTATTANRELWLDRIPFGGGGVNSTILHVASSRLPFGGRGTSGIGSYHGRAGFDAFSHHKSILIQPSRMDPGLNYPPYKVPLDFVKKLLR